MSGATRMLAMAAPSMSHTRTLRKDRGGKRRPSLLSEPVWGGLHKFTLEEMKRAHTPSAKSTLETRASLPSRSDLPFLISGYRRLAGNTELLPSSQRDSNYAPREVFCSADAAISTIATMWLVRTRAHSGFKQAAPNLLIIADQASFFRAGLRNLT